MKITKEQYEQLPDFMKAMFVQTDDGGYESKDSEDVGALKRGKDRERDAKKEAQKEAKELREKLKAYQEKEDADAEDKAKKEGDISKLQAKWEKKHKDEIALKDEEIASLTSEITSLVLDSTANELAQISTVPDLMVDVFKKRLSLDRENGKPIARVLDADGEISPMSLEDLKTEFANNPKYSAIMVASKASGGSKPSEPASGPASGGSDSQPVRFSDLSFSQQRAILKKEIDSEG